MAVIIPEMDRPKDCSECCLYKFNMYEEKYCAITGYNIIMNKPLESEEYCPLITIDEGKIKINKKEE